MEFLSESGFASLSWGNALLILLGIGFAAVAIIKRTEPYVLLPIGLGIILGNLPGTSLTDFDPSGEMQSSGIFGLIFHFSLSFWNILPPLIFLGLGALTDFGPIIANPKTMLLGAAAQLGIIGGADGPTTIFASAKLAPELLGVTAVVAYSYMASVVFVQPPLMRLLTTKKEREIRMRALRDVSKTEKLIFPAGAMIIIILLVPDSAPLIAMFMIGNLFGESGVVPRLSNAASNEILNIATIFLMLTIGTQLSAERVFEVRTLAILVLGTAAFACGTIGGSVGSSHGGPHIPRGWAEGQPANFPAPPRHGS